MISCYTRREIAALWTDEARMEPWRRVQVAAGEAMEGPSEGELDTANCLQLRAACAIALAGAREGGCPRPDVR